MNKTTPILILSLIILLLSSCSGIKYLTVETLEPAQIMLPADVLRVTIVNNVAQQPNNVGHDLIELGQSSPQRVTASADSAAIYYTEALAQFLEEEDYFLRVTYYDQPVRTDKDFFQEQLLPPERMQEIRNKTGADAIISLDRLILETTKQEHFRQQGYTYANLNGKINSTIRVYLPTMEGKIPRVQYTDSLNWIGFDIQDEKAYAEEMIPTREEAMMILAVNAAEKMTRVFAPHWEMQDRWYYTSSSSLMREGQTLAEKAQWTEAISKWELYFDGQTNKSNKAKAANNIALAYEMLDNMDEAYKWANVANDLFIESSSPNSLERRRSLLFLNEIERRRNTLNRIDMQTE